MATSKAYIAFILEQLSGLEGIATRKMMGEYILYHHGKIAAYLCDDRLLVKILPSTRRCSRQRPRSRPTKGLKKCCWLNMWMTGSF